MEKHTAIIAKSRLRSIIFRDRLVSRLSETLQGQAALLVSHAYNAPNLIAEQLLSVQPMTAETTQIFKIRYVERRWWKRVWNWLRKLKRKSFPRNELDVAFDHVENIIRNSK
jgi:hypothetical protein